MVFEYADGGTLSEHLQKYFPKLAWKDIHQLALGISDGLLYLHKLDIVHKDLVCVDMCIVKYVMELYFNGSISYTNNYITDCYINWD